MLNDIDVLRQMYATIFGGADRTLTLLDQGNVWTAKKVLQDAMLRSEEFYIAGEQAADELADRRKN